MKQNNSLLFVAITLIIVAFARLVDHPFNFTPLAAMALFGVYYMKNKWFAFLLPLLAIMFSDVLVNLFVQNEHTGLWEYFLNPTAYVVYGSLMLVGSLGLLMKNTKATSIVGFSILGSLLFYLVTNTAAWITDFGNLYSNDLSGLVQSLWAGIPFYNNEITGSFFLNQLAGDLFFNALLFGSYALASKRIRLFQTA